MGGLEGRVLRAGLSAGHSPPALTLRQAVASDTSQVEGPPEAGARTSHGSWLLPLLVTQGARRAGQSPEPPEKEADRG